MNNMQSNNEKDSRYADIINLPHHTSSKHLRMSRENRAAQFSPFAALTGYDAEITETARLTNEKIELDEDKVNDINAKLQYIIDHINEKPEISVEYFIPDEKKSGGAYVTVSGAVRIIDEYDKSVVFYNGKRIPIADIYTVDLLDSEEI